MAPRIPPKGSEPRGSAALPVSGTSSVPVISFDSIISDRHMVALEAPVVPPVELEAKSMNIRRSSSSSAGDSYLRHEKFNFKDGNITFLVDGMLYCVHQYFFARDSAYFSNKFTHLGVRDHEHLRTILSMSGIERADFEAFLSVLYPENFDEFHLSFEQWRSVLHLSTLWGFASIRRLALKSIKPPNACEKLLLARTYGVDNWVLPALSALCERKQRISIEEARRLSMEDVVLVGNVREEIRDLGFTIDTARIPGLIEAAQTRMTVHAEKDDGPPNIPEEPAEKESPKQAMANLSAEADGYDRTKEEAEPTPSEKGNDGYGSDEHLGGTTAESQKEKIDGTYETQIPTATPGDGLVEAGAEGEAAEWPEMGDSWAPKSQSKKKKKKGTSKPVQDGGWN